MPNSRSAIMTASGRYFDPLNPRAEDVDLGDLATALGRIVRFNGHTHRPITVAEHCLRVDRIADRIAIDDTLRVRRLVRLFARVHDAPEGYIGDIVTPIKTDKMRQIEACVMEVILDALIFGLSETFTAAEIGYAWTVVKEADALALYFEAMLWQRGADDWAPSTVKLDDETLAFLPDIAPRPGDDWRGAVESAIAALNTGGDA